jgi:phenylalanyl-tRNA synthetase beta chain
MKLPQSWLNDWIEPSAAPEALADGLTRRGFYVESLERHGHSYPGVVVARLIEVAKHPNADKLSLCRVDAGAGELRVVCGAPNVHPGMLAPLAMVGAKLPDGTVIRKSKIRGEESQGMLCSARELQLSDEHDGIVDLRRMLGNRGDLIPGRPFDDFLGPPEAVMEIEVPFNRPDGLSVLGLAREARAAIAGAWTPLAKARLSATWSPGPEDFSVTLEDDRGCPLYLAQAVHGIVVGPSPPWLAQRLEAIGQRAISNVVDVTNLVLFEMGQPLHAFDLAALRGPEIRVRGARAGERLTTLDGKDRELPADVLLICDRDRPVAIAGVMGGADTEVRDATTSLLLECAWFDPPRIRRGARALGLSTEASKRFERRVDPALADAAMARFIAVLLEICPGATLGEARRAGAVHAASLDVELRPARLRRVGGLEIAPAAVRAALEGLEFAVFPGAGDALRVRVPSHRPDVTVEDDLVEEVLRSHGYDRIPEAPPDSRGLRPLRTAGERTVTRARQAMVARGFTEAWTSTLVSEREAVAVAELVGEGQGLVRLSNAMSRESETLRPNPLAGLLRACALNLRQGAPAVRLFEVGVGFRARTAAGNDRTKDPRLPDETRMLAALVTGPRFAHAHDATQQEVDFLDAKGLWEAWLEEMRVDTPKWRAYASAGWKPGASAEVAAGASCVGWAGTLGQALLRLWDIDVPVHAFVVLLDPLSEATGPTPRASLPGRFPPVRRDLAYFVPEAVTHQELEGVLRRAGGEWLSSFELFDVYTGTGTPPGMKSLAFALRFQHPERTMAESEVQVIQDRMTEAVAKQCGGRLREK